MKSDVTLAVARTQWSHGFAALARLRALELAIDSSKGNLLERKDMEAMARLKTERDVLRRAIKTGTIWTDDGSS